jgi:hypothetical protein
MVPLSMVKGMKLISVKQYSDGQYVKTDRVEIIGTAPFVKAVIQKSHKKRDLIPIDCF